MKCNSRLATILFFLICIPVRLALVYIVKYLRKDYLPIVGITTLTIGLGFLSIYIFKLRHDSSGVETMGCPIWWNDYRPIHGALYIVSSMYAFNNDNNAYIPLLIDCIFSLILKVIKVL